MIVEQVPGFICSPEASDTFFFDKNGRFVYICRLVEETPILVVYDIMFNSYVQFTADPGIQNLGDNTMILDGNFWMFLPIDTKTILFATWGLLDSSVKLILLHLDAERKTYILVDQIEFLNFERPELVGDRNLFRLLCIQVCEDGRLVQTGEQLQVYVIQFVSIEAGRIKPGEKKELGLDCYCLPQPANLHLHNNKLWFTRKSKPHPSAPHYPPPIPPETEPPFHVCVSYFDLNDGFPQEQVIGKIKEVDFVNLQWYNDNALIIQLTPTKLGMLDLARLEWSYVEIGIVLINPRTNISNEQNPWAEFDRQDTCYDKFAGNFQFFCDQNFVLSLVNKQTRSLHRLPFRRPIKLMELAWVCALNAGRLDRLGSLDRSPFLRVF